MESILKNMKVFPFYLVAYVPAIIVGAFPEFYERLWDKEF